MILITVWLIRNIWVELYRIPHNQMEESLLGGDNLFINKWSYGLRLPQTPIAVPFFQDSITGTKMKSYSSIPYFPYYRIFPKEVKRNDIIVFNRPDIKNLSIPIDRRKIAIGRCVGLPGDTVRMYNGHVYINRREIAQPPHAKESYLIPDSLEYKFQSILRQLKIADPGFETIKGNRIRFFPKYQAAQIQSFYNTNTILIPIHLKRNNFTIILPRVDEPVQITPKNINLIYPLLVIHEGRSIIKKGNHLFENGKEIYYSRFTQPYYWIMGDNREKATDSRTFGAVPHSHVIGKGAFICFSFDPQRPFYKALRYNRIFKTID